MGPKLKKEKHSWTLASDLNLFTIHLNSNTNTMTVLPDNLIQYLNTNCYSLSHLEKYKCTSHQLFFFFTTMHLFSIIPKLKLVTLEKKVFHLHVLDVTHTYILVTSSEESSDQHEAFLWVQPHGEGKDIILWISTKIPSLSFIKQHLRLLLRAKRLLVENNPLCTTILLGTVFFVLQWRHICHPLVFVALLLCSGVVSWSFVKVFTLPSSFANSLLEK